MKAKLLKIWDFVLDLLFPPVCLACRRRLIKDQSGFQKIDNSENFSFLCAECSQKIKINNSAFCPACSRRLPENKKICHQESQFVLAAAGFYGNEVLDQLIILLKYQKIRTAAVPLAEILDQYIEILLFKTGTDKEDVKNFILIPIPLFWKRERQRGFNQALLIAKQLEKKIGLPVANNILKRIKNTASQVELKDREKRAVNIKDCFSVGRPELLSGKNVIVLDDVFTTGATMKEAASAIKKAGAKKIIGLVVAKT